MKSFVTLLLLVTLLVPASAEDGDPRARQLDDLETLAAQIAPTDPAQAAGLLIRAIALLPPGVDSGWEGARSAHLHGALAVQMARAGDEEHSLMAALEVVRLVNAEAAPATDLVEAYRGVELGAAALQRQSGYPAGDELRRRFETALDAERDVALLGRIAHQRGRAARAAGRPGAAIAAYTQAIELRHRAGDHEGLAWSLNNRGFLHIASEEWVQAGRDLGGAARVAITHGHRDIERAACHNLQLLLFGHGRAEDPDRPHAGVLFAAFLEGLGEAEDGAFVTRSWLIAGQLDGMIRGGARPPAIRAVAHRLVEHAQATGDALWAAHANLAASRSFRDEAHGVLDDVDERAPLIVGAASLARGAEEIARAAGDARLSTLAKLELARAELALARRPETLALVGEAIEHARAHGLRRLVMREIQALVDDESERIPELETLGPEWQKQAGAVQQVGGGIHATPVSSQIRALFAAGQGDATLARLRFRPPGSSSEHPHAFWTINAADAPKEVSIAVGDKPSWVKVGTWNLLLRGGFLQVADSSGLDSPLVPASRPRWATHLRTYAANPEETLLLAVDGGIRRQH